MKRLVVVSLVLALAGAVAPWNGSAGAAEPARGEAADCVDATVKAPGERTWKGQGVYGDTTDRFALHRAGSKAVALVRFVNTGTETTSFDFHLSHHEPGFDDSRTRWPDGISELEPGQAVTIRYVVKRTRAADPGDVSKVYFSMPTTDCQGEFVHLRYAAAPPCKPVCRPVRHA